MVANIIRKAKGGRLFIFLAALLMLSFESCQITEPTPKPKADFSVKDVGLGQILITNTSQNASRYQWSISDGQTSTEKEPTVVFSNNGRYVITLTAKNDKGEQDQTQKSVDILSLPTTGNVIFWTSFSSYSIKVYINGAYQGSNTSYLNAATTGPSCGTSGFVTVTLSQGTYNFTAEEDKVVSPLKWSGTISVVNGQCRKMQLTK